MAFAIALALVVWLAGAALGCIAFARRTWREAAAWFAASALAFACLAFLTL